jgi:ferredoxin
MDCLRVCPVDCFREGENFIVIDPEECIDCTLCVAECPAEAIFHIDDIPQSQKEFIALNSRLSKKWRRISEKINPPSDSDDWLLITNKFHLLNETNG